MPEPHAHRALEHVHDADVPLPPAPAWRPRGTDAPPPVGPAAEARIAAIAADWLRRADLPPARCDVCGALEERLASGRTRITHDQAVHDAAAIRAAAALEPPRRVATDDGADAPPTPARAPLPRIGRVAGRDDD
jgi:hypothetical protein